ncbi:MAG: hypothetical protein HC915_00710 [Anaerolineae bacterium]|nr:hypothetical protein [Anaerolineae bacterium]
MRFGIVIQNLGQDDILFDFLEDHRYQTDVTYDSNPFIGRNVLPITTYSDGSPLQFRNGAAVLPGSNSIANDLFSTDSFQYEFRVLIRPRDFQYKPEEDGYLGRGDIDDALFGTPFFASEREIFWEMNYITDLPPSLANLGEQPCGVSGIGDRFGGSTWTWTPFFIAANPLQLAKSADRDLAFANDIILYNLTLINISEQVDLNVEQVTDALLGPDLIEISYPNVANPTNRIISADGGFLPRRQSQGGGTFQSFPAFTDPPPGPYTVPPADPPAPNTIPMVYRVPPDAPEELVNAVQADFYAADNNLGFVPHAPGVLEDFYPPYRGYDPIMGTTASVEVLTEAPLQVTKEILSPLETVAPIGTTVEYQITITNTATAFAITLLNVQDLNPDIPLDCADASPASPATAGGVGNCLNFSADGSELQPAIVLGPAGSGSNTLTLLVNTVIPPTAAGTFSNTVIVSGQVGTGEDATLLPDVEATASIAVTPPVLTITPEIYEVPPGGTGTVLRSQSCESQGVEPYLRDATRAEVDRNGDGVPEISVNSNVLIQFEFRVGGNKTYAFPQENLVVAINNGSKTLEVDAQNALLTLAQSTAGQPNPVVGITQNAENQEVIFLRDSLLPPTGQDGAEPAEVTLCLPFLLLPSEVDPLEIIASILAVDISPGVEEEPEISFAADPLLIDLKNEFVFISKRVIPNIAFPGEQVTYRLEIFNESDNPSISLELLDVFDSRLGGQLFTDQVDPDGNPIPFDFHDPANGNGDCASNPPPTTSINFCDAGWEWPDDTNGQPSIGVLPSGTSATFTYTQDVLITDPDPLVNEAGVLARIVDSNGGELDGEIQSDETRASLRITESQLLVEKVASPVVTVLGNQVRYQITVTNVGQANVFDVLVWDDRFNLEFPTAVRLQPGPNVTFFTEGNQDPNGDGIIDVLEPFDAFSVEYRLPTLPRCVAWNGPDVVPWSPANPSGVQGTSCDAYNSSTGRYGNAPDSPSLLDVLDQIDPFINTAFATGTLVDGNTDTYLPVPGSDTAVVDLLNLGLRISKQANVSGATIGDNVTYTIRLINTGDNPVRIDRVIDSPDGNIPPGPSLTGDLPIESFTLTDCEEGFQVYNGTNLIPTSAGGSTVVPIVPNITAVLIPECVAVATITLQVPNVFPANEYVNVVKVEGQDLVADIPLLDLTSEQIEIRTAGLIVNKRALNCDPASNGINTPTEPIPGTQSVCTFQTGAGGLTPGAELVGSQSEGQGVFYEITLGNFSFQEFDRVVLTDAVVIDPDGTTAPNTVLNATGQTYTPWNWRTNNPGTPISWNAMGQLIIQDPTPNGQASYSGPPHPQIGAMAPLARMT